MKKLIIATLAVAAAVGVQAATKVLTLGSMAAEDKTDYTASASLGALATKDTITLSYVTDAGSLAGKSTVTTNELDSTIKSSLGKADTALQEHQSLADYAKTDDLGDLAAMDTITLSLVTDAGDLAALDTITLAKVTDAGTLAGKSEVAKTDLASGVQTSLGKADSAVQSVSVTTADNGGISVSVDGGTAVSTSLGTAATTAASAYATAAQGTKADNALPAAKLTVGGTAMTPSSTAVELGSGYITVTGENNVVDIYKR